MCVCARWSKKCDKCCIYTFWLLLCVYTVQLYLLIDCILCNFHKNLCHLHISMVLSPGEKEKDNKNKKMLVWFKYGKNIIVSFRIGCDAHKHEHKRDHLHMFEIVNNQEFYCIFCHSTLLYAIWTNQRNNNEIIVNLSSHCNKNTHMHTLKQTHPNAVYHKLFAVSHTDTTHIATTWKINKTHDEKKTHTLTIQNGETRSAIECDMK